MSGSSQWRGSSMGSSGGDRGAGQIAGMFSRLVPHYDRMNRVMTAGLDGRWRRAAVSAAGARGGDVLDLGCGTGDLSAEFVRQGAGSVTGVDFSGAMLREAWRKYGDGALWLRGDALRLPFGEDSFDAVGSAFVLRNLVDLELAFGEMLRVLRPGGRLVALDITHPPENLYGRVLRVGFEQGVTRVAGLLSGDRGAYRYLPRSLEGYPTAWELSGLLEGAGAVGVSYRRLGGGSVALHRASAP